MRTRASPTRSRRSGRAPSSCSCIRGSSVRAARKSCCSRATSRRPRSRGGRSSPAPAGSLWPVAHSLRIAAVRTGRRAPGTARRPPTRTSRPEPGRSGAGRSAPPAGLSVPSNTMFFDADMVVEVLQVAEPLDGAERVRRQRRGAVRAAFSQRMKSRVTLRPDSFTLCDAGRWRAWAKRGPRQFASAPR